MKSQGLRRDGACPSHPFLQKTNTMNKKRLYIHLFCLLLFTGGCCIFWLLGGGQYESEFVAEGVEGQTQSQKLAENRLVNQTSEEQGRITSHDTSMKGENIKQHPISPVASLPQPVKISAKKECESKSEQPKVTTEPSESSYNIANDKPIGFNNLNKNAKTNNLIRAIIHNDQNITEEDKVKLRLLDDVTINGILIPKNSMLYAASNFSADRIYLNTETITFQKKVYPLNAVICDLDGVEGIPRLSTSKVTLSAGYKVIVKIKEN